MKTNVQNKIIDMSLKDISKALFTLFPPEFDKKPSKKACKLAHMLDKMSIVVFRNSAKKNLESLYYHNSSKRKSKKAEGVSITTLPDNHKLQLFTPAKLLANKINNLFRNFRVFGFSKTAESYNTSNVSKIRVGSQRNLFHQHFKDDSCEWVVEYAVLNLSAELCERKCIGLEYANKKKNKENLPVEVMFVISIDTHENYKFADAVPVLSESEVTFIKEEINKKLGADHNIKNFNELFSRKEREEFLEKASPGM